MVRESWLIQCDFDVGVAFRPRFQYPSGTFRYTCFFHLARIIKATLYKIQCTGFFRTSIENTNSLKNNSTTNEHNIFGRHFRAECAPWTCSLSTTGHLPAATSHQPATQWPPAIEYTFRWRRSCTRLASSAN